MSSVINRLIALGGKIGTIEGMENVIVHVNDRNSMSIYFGSELVWEKCGVQSVLVRKGFSLRSFSEFKHDFWVGGVGYYDNSVNLSLKNIEFDGGIIQIQFRGLVFRCGDMYVYRQREGEYIVVCEKGKRMIVHSMQVSGIEVMGPLIFEYEGKILVEILKDEGLVITGKYLMINEDRNGWDIVDDNTLKTEKKKRLDIKDFCTYNINWLS
jgi:hypothetical protein